MPDTEKKLQVRLEAAVAPGFRERLLDKGLARGLIWRDGLLPEGSPPFPDSLTEDLLDYAYAILAMALRLRSRNSEAPVLTRAFLVGGEAIEAAVHRGDDRRTDNGFNRVSAAIAFHLGGYAARAYSILPAGSAGANLSPSEKVLAELLRRSLDEMHEQVAAWLLNNQHQDKHLAKRLQQDDGFDETDALQEVLTTSLMRGIALFDHAVKTGATDSADEARQRLSISAQMGKDTHFVSHWWTATLATHLIDELWKLSLYQQIPLLALDQDGYESWNTLRRNYIQRLRAGRRSAVALWPSQLEAARRAVDPADDLVVALPTSAGKTRIAELCILRALALDRRVVYVTPLRALSAQVEHDLAETFSPLGFWVSSLYGSAGIERGDTETLRKGKIVVSTPEKLDFALRNDSTIIDDVGLVVLDEGHMLGPNEREVRYEALVQRLLRRPDADSRRVVCLSALFPTPEEMSDLVAWIRQDQPGDPVYTNWRPTRQRFGVLQWQSDAARLDVAVEEESPFVPRFIESRMPSQGSRRRKKFPSDKNELTLAATWRFVELGQDVLVYCSLRKSVESLGKLVIKCIGQGVLKPLREPNQRIRDAIATGTEWLGGDHTAVKCLQYGVAIHHGGLPRSFLNHVERLLRFRDCPLIIASPTLAQGLNLSASVLIVPSIWRNQELIPAAEFANVAGRAGRAFVDVEGLVLHIVWEEDFRRRNWSVGKWHELVAAAKAPRVESGLLLLAWRIYQRIAEVSGVPLDEVVEYVMGHSNAWEFRHAFADKDAGSAEDWERDIASLDSAILALLNAETEVAELGSELDNALEGSLFSRQLLQHEQKVQTLLRGLVLARAHRIWHQTNEFERKGYHVAGVGLRAGQFLDANIESLIDLLIRAELGVVGGKVGETTEAVVEFAEFVFQTAQFRAPGKMPKTWKVALQAWLEGLAASEVIRIGGEDGVDLLQDALTYRLPWAMEAVRVHASALGHEDAGQLQGLAALAVEAGSVNLSVITLIRSGLSSREAAIESVATTGASFNERAGMTSWLRSEDVKSWSAQDDWPTARSRHAWLQFYEGEIKGKRRKWKRETQKIRVEWLAKVPESGVHVIIEPNGAKGNGLVLTPDFIKLGVLESVLRRPHSDVVDARVGEPPKTVLVEFFGPPDNSGETAELTIR